MIDQLDARLVKPEAHFRATFLLPSKMNFTLTDPQILAMLQPIYAENSPYYDDIVEHGDIDSVEREFQNWITRWRAVADTDRPKRILTCMNSLNMDLFPNVLVVFLHFLTLPVTTCSAERSFSEMRLLKTWLRSTMGDERLTSLALMHFNYNIEIPFDELIIKWSQQKNRLINLDITEWLECLEG